MAIPPNEVDARISLSTRPGWDRGHLLGDRAAERYAQDVGAGQAQVIQDGRADVGQAPHRHRG
jgi:hypothetical protein